MKIHGVMAGILAFTVASIVGAESMGAKSEQMTQKESKEAMSQPVFVCPDCHTMALKAGKCPMCQKELQESHLLGVKDGEALVCACGAGCSCNAKDMKEGKCGCGKEVKKMSAKGMYVCPEGCPVISEKAEKCPHCGMEMKKVE